MFCMLFVFVCE